MDELGKDHKRIAIITNSISGGGAENAMYQVFQGLRNHYRTMLIAVNRSLDSQKPVDEIMVLDRNWGSGVLQTVKVIFSLNKIFKEFRPTVVIVNCELPELLVALSFQLKGRIVCVEHTSRPWIGRRTVGIFVRGLLRLRQAEWVTVSKGAKSIWKGDDNFQYIPNPVSRPQMNNHAREPNTIFMGRLTQGKRPEWAIRASAIAQVRLQVFGDGPLLRELQNLARLESCKVVFHGYKDNCWQELSTNDILIMPSAYEGDGIVVGEAILAGIRILVADNSDLRRFGLPEECYCSTAEEMGQKLKRIHFEDQTRFRLSQELRREFLEEREVERVILKWRTYLA